VVQEEKQDVIWVNGNVIRWTEGMKVVDLAAKFGYLYLVVVNGTVVPFKDHKTYQIPAGAEVRLVHLVDGG
jgi:thiamine biosynthesis protein ThiS